MRYLTAVIFLGGLYYYLSAHGSAQAAQVITAGAAGILLLIAGLFRDA